MCHCTECFDFGAEGQPIKICRTATRQKLQICNNKMSCMYIMKLLFMFPKLYKLCIKSMRHAENGKMVLTS